MAFAEPLEPGFNTSPDLLDNYQNTRGGYCCSHEDRFLVPANRITAVDDGWQIILAPYGTPYIYFVPQDEVITNRDDSRVWLYILRSVPSVPRCLLMPAVM